MLSLDGSNSENATLGTASSIYLRSGFARDSIRSCQPRATFFPADGDADCLRRIGKRTALEDRTVPYSAVQGIEDRKKKSTAHIRASSMVRGPRSKV